MVMKFRLLKDDNVKWLEHTEKEKGEVDVQSYGDRRPNK